MEDTKVHSVDQIMKIAPGYRDKPENFDLSKIKGKPSSSKAQSKLGPSTDKVPQPKFLNEPQTPTETTPQKNNLMINEGIFGIGVSITLINPRQSFASSYANIPQNFKRSVR